MKHAFRSILVISGSGIGEILQGNPDVTGVVEVCRRRGMRAPMRFLRRRLLDALHSILGRT